MNFDVVICVCVLIHGHTSCIVAASSHALFFSCAATSINVTYDKVNLYFDIQALLN